MDGRSAGVIPALESGRAALLDRAEVREIHDDGAQVTGLTVVRNGEATELTAGAYALAAGSLGSARLLLASQGRHPEGCANSSGWVGRGLMFHLNEIFLLWPYGRQTGAAFGKSISLRDLYSVDGQRFGLVQSLGLDASYGNISGFLGQLFDQSPLARFRRLRVLTRPAAFVMSRIFGHAGVFVGIMEDFPYPKNRVVLNNDDPEILTFEYSFHPELLKRRKAFRRAMKRAFRKQRRLVASLHPILNYGHPLGTLRFGNDPRTSVLRPDCRTHDLANLYVADGSFMPSALGVNPSLMIAANALRVGDIMADAKAAEE
jgi:choline dehydrogenase-like flavoprotein